MINNYMKQCSPSLAIQEMQIEITLKFNLIVESGYHPNINQ